MWRASLRSRYWARSKPFTSPAIWQDSRDGSKRLILVMPELPARMLAQASVTLLPTGEIMPNPVITTLRRDKFAPEKGALGAENQAFLAWLVT